VNAPPAAVRIVLVHAVQVAMEPIEEAFRSAWPQAQLVHLLDDSLSPDRAAQTDLSPAMSQRIALLADYALCADAQAVLYTCSAFGPAIEAVASRLAVPVLKPNEAMFEAALRSGGRIGMLATFAPSVESMTEEFNAMARASGQSASLKAIVVPEAMTALRAGDVESHNQLLADAAPALTDCAAVMLAHFSTSRALSAVQARLPCPVLTSPGSAVSKLKALLLGAQ
jgi:Asp/Glu/Hydantoin racemase